MLQYLILSVQEGLVYCKDIYQESEWFIYRSLYISYLMSLKDQLYIILYILAIFNYYSLSETLNLCQTIFNCIYDQIEGR